MIQLIKKEEQFNTRIFNGNFIVNKPVAIHTKPAVAPYANLFYWSHAIAIDECEFGLHAHEGFEIMTFILEGSVAHYDTVSAIWTSLGAGDFQIIQSNSGVAHQERIAKGTRSFQIWFDPNFHETVKRQPDYCDYHQEDFPSKEEHGVSTITYVGGASIAKVLTLNIAIKKLSFEESSEIIYPLDTRYTYTWYALQGKFAIHQQTLEENDIIRIQHLSEIKISCSQTGHLFLMQTPLQLHYRTVWEK